MKPTQVTILIVLAEYASTRVTVATEAESIHIQYLQLQIFHSLSNVKARTTEPRAFGVATQDDGRGARPPPPPL